MTNTEEIKASVLKSFVKTGYKGELTIDLSKLDFTGYTLDLSGIKADTIINSKQQAKRNIYNDKQQATCNIYNDNQTSNVVYNREQASKCEIYNINQTSNEDIYNCGQLSLRRILNDNQTSIKIINSHQKGRDINNTCQYVTTENEKVETD